MKSAPAQRYDVVILGTGIGGTILGAILAKQGLRVLMLEQAVHPRFAIGESTVPETTMLFRILARRYGVPEIAHLSSYQLVRRHVSASCGVKRNFTFVCHRPGEPQLPLQAAQFPTLSPPFGPDLHMFRQDVDAYMLSVALSYGASVRQQTPVVDLSFGPDGVEVQTKDGERIEARFVVDAGGLKSMIAHKLGLRVEPNGFKTRSRSIYTHMVGVLPYDACHADRSVHGLPMPFAQGTLHHLFDRAWMWVIPFDNHPMSTNRVVSVGLNLDCDKYPKNGTPPAEEFRAFVARYPNLAKQFGNAVPIRDWIGTDRLQFTSSCAVGDRFAMLPHAFAFVDPLFSSGLGVTMSAINMLADRLIRAAADDDFRASRFADVDTWTKANYRYYDRLVAASYVTFAHFDLWNAWMKLWMMGSFYGVLGGLEMLHAFEKAADPRSVTLPDQFPFRAAQGAELPRLAALFDASEAHVDAVRDGTESPESASASIFKLVQDSGLWPATWGRPTPALRHPGTFTLWPFFKAGMWFTFRAPADVREHYFVNSSVARIVPFTAREWWNEFAHAQRSIVTLTRDFLFPWNTDWKRTPSPPPALPDSWGGK